MLRDVLSVAIAVRVRQLGACMSSVAHMQAPEATFAFAASSERMLTFPEGFPGHHHQLAFAIVERMAWQIHCLYLMFGSSGRGRPMLVQSQSTCVVYLASSVYY
ncbi:hypothetical protein DENSPDRAFT_835982 [Dentipellis sp. KUC8613]|nr:hypothetical protein DENSPDRAFT_835982 [Dentipellis sp. KUC8613]